ncbi:glycosyltransferase family 4 protein [Candidatus Saccharibacteria bacterium]|nr:glycosyltransferase family 4 protein [Candidatus Saccharibacteria bacterium]
MKSILINQPRSSYYVGGAEMVSLQHARYFQQLGYDVTFITVSPLSAGQTYSDQYNNFKNRFGNLVNIIEIAQQNEALPCYDVEPGESRDRWNVESIYYNRSLFEYLIQSGLSYDACISYYKLDALVVPKHLIGNNLLYLCGVPKESNEFMSCFLSAYDTILAITSDVKKYWQEYTKKNIQIVETGVEIDRFLPNTKKGVATRVLYVGRLIERKGLDTLVDALSLMPAPAQAKVQVQIVGSGPMLYLLKEKILSNGLSKVISLEGESSTPEKFFGSADICVFPSRGGEGLQGVVLEAMSSGCYVIASDTEINRGLLQGGRGSILEKKSAEELSHELLRIMEDEDLVEAGSMARDYVVANYSWQTVIKKLEKYI